MNINWSGYRWLTHERWGQVHPDKPWNWYDPYCVSVREGVLNLNVMRSPRDFMVDGVEIHSPNGTGLISSVDDFGFGRFEIEAKLPRGRGLWPAFWLYASDAWPPEIDIFEGYSRDRNYKKCLLKPYRLESCVHVRESWMMDKIPARSPWRWRFNSDPSVGFNVYSLEWSYDRIEWFINGASVRRITDDLLLKSLSGYKMRVIVNNHIDGNYKDNWTCESPFEIRRFEYIEL